ncbi:IPT/TIG domain-containing protein [Archangium minus]|uniref:IPT/TIG domain-containing protein n=1 Tax=Archangium minus TaxID=83450 RepID=UPI0037BE8FCA
MALTVTNAVPAFDRASGGERITLTGTDFARSVRVKFGDVKATKVERVNSTTLIATAPAQLVAGPVTITVTNDPGYLYDGGPTAACGTPFRYYPHIKSIDSHLLPTAGGAVTIHGEGFPVGAQVQVRSPGVGSIDALMVTRVSATRITCTLQQHPLGPAEVCVLIPGDLVAYGFGIRFCEPMIHSISPGRVRPGGGTQVTITGQYFVHNSAVTFNGMAAAAVAFTSSKELRVHTPAHPAGPVQVVVTNPALGAVVGVSPAPVVGASSGILDAFEFGASEVVSIDPPRGPVAGGTQVTIKGRGLLTLAVNGVQIGGAAVNALLVDEKTVTATTPAFAPGPVNVSVQNSLGDPVAVLANGFTFVPRATVTAVDPAQGPEGTEVTIQGTSFEKGAEVRFGGEDATDIKVLSPTAIRCKVPAHAHGAVDVEVQNDGGDTGTLVNGYTYTGFRVEPRRGLPAGGENVTIHMPFLPPPGAAVTFDGTAAASAAGPDFVVTTPAHAVGLVDIDVDGETLMDGFEYAAITKVEPNAGPPGTTVNIHGAGFDGTTAVSFGGVAAAPVTIISANQLRVASPVHAMGPVDVVVTQSGAGTFTQGYTFQPAATVTAVEPATGTSAGGTDITVTGTGFVKGAGVFIAGVAATNVEVISPTTLTARTPAAAVGPPFAAVNVSVLNPGAGGPSVGNNLWTYRNPPTVTANAQPAQGPDTGGRAITVTGADFLPDAKVLVDGQEAADVEVVNATTLRCRVPAHAAGPVSLAVQNPGDPTPGPIRANAFTYVVDPHTSTGGNFAQFLLDGENFFGFLEYGFEQVRQAPPDPKGLTYVRLAYWNAHDDVTIGGRAVFGHPNHRLLHAIERVVRAGHHVEVILWRPNALESKVDMGRGVFSSNADMAKHLYDMDVAMAAVEGAGRVRVYFEHSEGETGSSIHQKIAIFSIRGIRHAVIGGLNLSNAYFAAPDHSFPPLANQCQPWHDAAIYIRGPATDDVEREWMRRWRRTEALEATWYGMANMYGYNGEFLARDFSFFESATVRRRAIETVDNTTLQPHDMQNTPVTIAVTRSEGTTRHTHIRDKVIERINAANNYIYFENYHFSDPDLVQAIVARHRALTLAGGNLRVVVVIPHPMDAASGYMTRRAWLHFALTFEDGSVAPAAPYCTRVVYDIGAGPVTVLRAACGANWNVFDCYNPAAPTATNWLENDTLTFDAGAGPVVVRFHQILAVESAMHFYTPQYIHPGPPASRSNTVYTHSKVAAFDGQWLVVGSANWSFRSMQYDGEISAFVDSAPLTTLTVASLLNHYNTAIPTGAVTPLNAEAAARHNAGAPGMDHISLFPCEYYNSGAPLAAGNPILAFPRAVPPSPSLSTLRAFMANLSYPNYTWL